MKSNKNINLSSAEDAHRVVKNMVIPPVKKLITKLIAVYQDYSMYIHVIMLHINNETNITDRHHIYIVNIMV